MALAMQGWRSSLFNFLLLSLFVLASARYEAPRDVVLEPAAPFPRDAYGESAASGVLKRAVDMETVRERGKKLHCLMEMTRDEVQASEGKDWESPSKFKEDGLEQREGWGTYGNTPLDGEDTEMGDGDDDDDDEEGDEYGREVTGEGYGLRDAFDNLLVSREGADLWVTTKRWDHDFPWEFYEEYNEDGTGVGIPKYGYTTGAYFQTAFIVPSGVLVAEDNLSVAGALKKYEKPTVKQLTDAGETLPQVQFWNDAAWMQWVRACKEEGGDTKSLSLIIRSSISNLETLEVVANVVAEFAKDDPVVGQWGSKQHRTFTRESNPDALDAILGTPNGASTARFLISHKEDIELKKIDSVDIFLPADKEATTPRNWDVTDKDEDAKTYSLMLLFTLG